MAASDHLSPGQFPRMPLDEVLKLPSVDGLDYGPVADVLPSKERDMQSGWEKDHYDRLRQRMADHGQETPVHIFTAGRRAYGSPIPRELRGQLMMGNGHHRVAMARQLGITDIAYTPDKQKSATEEDT